MIRLQLPCSMKYRDLAMRMVASACKLIDMPNGSFDDQVISAFGEAFNNAVLHSYGPEGGELQIEIDAAPDRMTICIKDYGRAFDIASVRDPDLESLPESGLGLFIMRSCMDDVSYTPGQPNVLCMTKFLMHDERRTCISRVPTRATRPC